MAPGKCDMSIFIKEEFPQAYRNTDRLLYQYHLSSDVSAYKTVLNSENEIDAAYMNQSHRKSVNEKIHNRI